MYEYHNDWHIMTLKYVFNYTVFTVCGIFWSHIGRRVRSIIAELIVWECFIYLFIFISVPGETGMYPVINSDEKRKHTTPESCAKNMIGSLLSLKTSICKILMCMFWRLLGSQDPWRYLGGMRRCMQQTCIWQQLNSTKQFTKQMHKYGNLLSLSKCSAVIKLCPIAFCDLCGLSSGN